MAFSTGTSGQTSEINVTPLIDVLLVLLIIFMMIVPLNEHGLPSRLPQPGNAAAAVAETAPLVLEVMAAADSAGPPQVRLNSHVVAQEELSARLQSLLAARSDRTVFVRGDRALAFDAVARTVADAKRAGAEPIALMSSGAH